MRTVFYSLVFHSRPRQQKSARSGPARFPWRAIFREARLPALAAFRTGLWSSFFLWLSFRPGRLRGRRAHGVSATRRRPPRILRRGHSSTYALRAVRAPADRRCRVQGPAPAGCWMRGSSALWDGARQGHASGRDSGGAASPLLAFESSACTCTVAGWPQAGVSAVGGCPLGPRHPAPSLVVRTGAEGRKALPRPPPLFVHWGRFLEPDDVVCFSNSHRHRGMCSAERPVPTARPRSCVSFHGAYRRAAGQEAGRAGKVHAIVTTSRPHRRVRLSNDIQTELALTISFF